MRGNRNKQKNLSSLLYPRKVWSAHGLIENVVHCLRPDAIVQNSDVRKYIKYDNIFLNFFKIYTEKLSKKVKYSIAECPTDITTLNFDG